jgi:hypothetical protein
MPEEKSANEVVCDMNEFISAMSTDMGISRYQSESDDSFVFRLCYSALGQWCLRTAQNSSNGIVGTTKHNQTIVINELLHCYGELFPCIINMFFDASNPQMNFPVHIRRLYEETGYLLTYDSNRNRLANYGRSIAIGSSALFLGAPTEGYTVNGLGVFSPFATHLSTTRDFLIRDKLSSEEFLGAKFDIIDFYEKDISIDELQFFNPLSTKVPSQSWSTKIFTDYSVARKSELGPFYRVIQTSGNSLFFADEIIEPQSDRLISYEYRRLYFALKAHYNNPLNARVVEQNEEYSKIRISGHLPNREYYFLLLLSWPVNHVFDRTCFLIKNDFFPKVATTLKNIGIDIKGGNASV